MSDMAMQMIILKDKKNLCNPQSASCPVENPEYNILKNHFTSPLLL